MIIVQDALSYDRFHPHPDRTFRILSDYTKKNGEHWSMASSPLPLATALQKDSNIIEAVTTVYPALGGTALANGKELYIDGVYVDPSFFRMFGFRFENGDPVTALQRPNTAVISKAAALNFFNTTDVVGKVIKMAGGVNYTITGVLEAPPGKSHLNYAVYGSYSTVAQLEQDKLLAERSAAWYAFNASYTYIVLKPHVGKTVLQSRLNTIAAALNRENKDGSCAFGLQPLDRISPGQTDLGNDNARGTSWAKLYFTIGLGMLILLAACFNYTNLTIARGLTRAKEVGVRKISGARRYHIFLQYVLEGVLLSLLALVFASVILAFILKYQPFNDGYEMIPATFRYDLRFVILSLLYAVAVGIIAGIFPAWILSSFTPLRVLKKITTARILGNVSLQRALIVFQYSLSLVFIIFLFAFYKQFSFLSESDPGFRRSQVLVVPLNGLNETVAKQQIASIAGIRSVSAASVKFSARFGGMNEPIWMSDRDHAINLNYYYAGSRFVTDMELAFIAGKNFPDAADNDREQYILLNEKAAHAYGFSDAGKAVGQKLWINDTTPLEVTGVLKDFNYENMGKPVFPLAIRNRPAVNAYLYIQTATTDKARTASEVLSALKTLDPRQTFTSSWLEEDLEASNSQTATISLLGFLGFIALSVATLGLLGLVVYTVEIKNKEIGVRKVIGASKKQLVQTLSGGFVTLLLIAGAISMPVGWILSKLFLQNFVLRSSFGFGSIVLCFLFLLGVGLFTIISQTLKAAAANPVNALRSE